LRCNIDLCSHEHVEPWCLEKEALLITLFDDHASTKADPVTLDEQFANHFGSDWQKWEFNSTFNEYLLPCNKQEESGSVEKDPVEEVTNENDVSSSFKRLCCR